MPNNGSAALLLRLGLAEQLEDHADEMQALRRLICAEGSSEERKYWKACLRKLNSPETLPATLIRHGKRARAASAEGTISETSCCGSSEAASLHNEMKTSRMHDGDDGARGQHQGHIQGERAASAVGPQARSHCAGSAPNRRSSAGLIRPGQSSTIAGVKPCSTVQTGRLCAGGGSISSREEPPRRADIEEAGALAARTAARSAGPLLALWAKPQARAQTQPVQDRVAPDAETRRAPPTPPPLSERASVAARHGDAAPDLRAAQLPRAAAAGMGPAKPENEATSPVRSSTQKKFEEELQCPICMDLLYEPVSIKCGHSFCRSCLLRATEHQRPRCPCCRAVLESNYIPKVNVLLWNLIQNSFSAQIKQHANAKLSKATEALELARRDGALRDRLRAEMLQHRDVLVAANPQYFQTLELELKRPTSEIFRCECLQRFICLRKRVSNLASTSFGREYVGCPLYSSVDPSRGCRFYTNIV